ncbi:hypothetical protein KVP09_14650 [Alcaligenaceae bacterium CGII-47]|nr:hypothetical protein [Alcaligenaceae bacterium CGII-47]
MDRRLSTVLLGVPLALMAAGSLRDLITPLVYWAAWLLWAAVIAVLLHPQRTAWAESRPPKCITVSYGLLLLGMSLSAVMNQDMVTAYQMFKIIVIAGIFLMMWWLVLYVDWSQLLTALYWVVSLIIISVVFTVVTDPQGQWPVMGGRQGSVLASYGVLWKVGALFLPIFLADLIVRPRAWAINTLMIVASIYLLMIDGSRTAQLVLVATLIGLLFFTAWRSGRRALLQKLPWLLLVPVIFAGMQLFGNRTFSTRLGEGDPARMKLLNEGVPQAIDCLPMGCGFGRTATDIGQGTPMPVHNAYLAALGDFGVLGMLGLMGFLLAACLPIRRVIRNPVRHNQDYFVVAAAGSALAYGMSLMLNTFTTEMSEWGYVILMLAFAWAPAKAN